MSNRPRIYPGVRSYLDLKEEVVIVSANFEKKTIDVLKTLEVLLFSDRMPTVSGEVFTKSPDSSSELQLTVSRKN